jgi:menaquinol-cytochrome c reductase cytochrome b/c subunit
LFLKDRTNRLRWFYLTALAMLGFLLAFHVYVAVAPTVLVALAMIVAANSTPESHSRLRRYLALKPLAYWIMTWFLFELIVLTAVGTWFRGPGWSWVWPWRS